MHLSTRLLKAATNETRTSNPHRKQVVRIRSPAIKWLPLKPAIEVTPKVAAILVPIDVKPFQTFATRMNITMIGRRKKKPEIVRLRMPVNNDFMASSRAPI